LAQLDWSEYMPRSRTNVPTSRDNCQPAEEKSPFGANDRKEPDVQEESPTETPPRPHSEPQSSPAALDPFNPETYRLQPSLVIATSVEKHITELPVRKPDKSWWVRVHPDPAFALATFVIELKEEQEVYLVLPSLWQALQGEPTFTALTLHLAVTRQGKLFLWPVRRPLDPSQEPTRWMRPTLEAISCATSKWTRISWNQDTRQHDVSTCPMSAEPQWPDLPFRDLLKIAFRDFVIDRHDHPVLRRLRGEE
jgi:hypothetical protein